MTLRVRLFLLVAALLSLMLVAQALLVRSLARRLTEDVREVAARVGNEILSGFEFHTNGEREGGAHVARVVVLTGRVSGATGTPPAPAAPDLPRPKSEAPPEAGTPHWVVRRELHFKSDGSSEEPTAEKRVEVHVAGGPGEPGGIARRFGGHLRGDEDVLFLRGPEIEREIPISHAEVSSTLASFGSGLLLGSLALLALGLGATAWVAHRVTRPLAELATAARRVGEGELGVAVVARRRDEVGQAIASFNRMSERLVALDEENRRLQARRQLAELGDVARGLAHSLRNPLNALGLSLEELGARAEPESDPGPLVETARRQIRRIDGSLRSFLALASGGEAATEAVDLPALASEVALEALQDARGKVRIEVAVAEALPPLAAVPAELRAALQALVVNAVEASPPGATVTVRLAPAALGRARVEVEDAGPGVPETVRGRLFMPHVTTKPHGSGMGLYLAHRLATGRYHGSVELVARTGGGTIARLELQGREGEGGG